MKAYAHLVAGRWYGFVQTPLGFWVPLDRNSTTKEFCERYLRGIGFEVVQRRKGD
jgi:hypothetical protein